MLPFPEAFKDVVNQSDLDVFDHGRYAEIVQMLSDLGFITISPEEGKILDAGDLKEGVMTFRREAISVSLIGKSGLQMPFPEIPEKKSEKIISYHEFSVLQLLVSLDGDFTLKPISEIRESRIYTRVLQYRLHLLGLLKKHPDGNFSEQINLALDKLAHWLLPVQSAKLLDLTGNISQLISRLVKNDAFANKLVYFKYNQEFSDKYSIAGVNSSFFDQLRNDIDRKSDEFKNLRQKSRRNKFDSQFFESKCNDTDSKFLVRLMQISQWTSGYYLGKIDGELGEFTFESFLQLARGEAENDNIDFKMYLFVGYISEDYWVVNPHYLLHEMSFQRSTDVGTISKVFNSYNEEYEKLDHKLKETVDTNMQTAWKSVNIDFCSDLRSTNNRFRRIYYGARSLLQSFWKGINGIFEKLKEKVTDFVRDLTSLVKNFAKFLYREIREALQIFSRGLNFLFGDRKEESSACYTQFDFDMDNHTCILVPFTDNSLEEHLQKLITTTSGLKFCLKLTGKLIHLTIAASLGWPRLVVEAGIILKQLLKERYSDKEYEGFVIDPQG